MIPMETGIQIEIKEDEKYFRVYIKFGTHTLHSEKMNIESTMELSHQIKNHIGRYNEILDFFHDVIMKESKV